MESTKKTPTKKWRHNHPVEIYKENVRQIKKDLKCIYRIKLTPNSVLFSQEMFNTLSAVLWNDTQYLSQALHTTPFDNPQPNQAEGSMFPRNFGNRMPSGAASYPRNTPFSFHCFVFRLVSFVVCLAKAYPCTLLLTHFKFCIQNSCSPSVRYYSC